MFDEGQVAIVTGAGPGMGRAIAVGFAERGVDVPGAMSVVGCDDVFGADLVRPGLTTIAAPLERAGHAAADLLLARLDPTHPGGTVTVELPTHLVVRGSTGTAPLRVVR